MQLKFCCYNFASTFCHSYLGVMKVSGNSTFLVQFSDVLLFAFFSVFSAFFGKFCRNNLIYC